MPIGTKAGVAAIASLALVLSAVAREPGDLANPSIDMAGYLAVAATAAAHRESHRVSEREFLRLAREPGTIILDARSREKYDELHVIGALNMSFPDIAIGSLRQTIPNRSTRILIYCNNNFVDAEGPFPMKLPAASLNLSTYIALYTYGYRNVWELGPRLDIAQSMLSFEGTSLVSGLVPVK
ncbi:MAG TPA: rhodanese-like domain-containing protein [Candidatus Cybelea sp.]|nr:rhodanese-like domain-containing protein [Candidatus Cybelea sp.]